VAAWNAAIAAADARYRQELARPLLPLLSVGYSYGDFGGGSNQADTEFGHFRGRSDFDVYAVWILQNAGLGNLALQKGRRVQINEALAQRAQAVTQIRREVADAYALSATRLREVEVARKRVETALKAFELDMTRVRGRQGLPIELQDSVAQLVRARQELVAAIIGYDQAQFQLYVALGRPPFCALQAARAEAAPVAPSPSPAPPKREDKGQP
jgi:outer membrane protein TolC